jgi:DNA helicase-2/ATP-dependent DNA helicase PcrA
MKAFFTQTLLEFYEDLSEFLKEKKYLLYLLKKIPIGKIKEFVDLSSTKSLLDNLILPEENSYDIRTIHKAEGMEFESVLLYLTSIDAVQKLIAPDIDSEKDDTSIFYIGSSRARTLLCIACPPLNNKTRNKLKKLKNIEPCTM